MRKLLIDADVLVYETAFAAQKTKYCYNGQWFNSAKECESYCDENNLVYRDLRKEGLITSAVEVLPEAACRNIFRQKVDAIKMACGSDDYTFHLSGDGNFRDAVGVTKVYKGNRANAVKPQHYLYARQLLLEDRRTECTTGVEADDAMGIECTANPGSVICTIDKDLNMIPGYHYDWNKKIKYKVSEFDGLYYFCKQMLMGDSTDNIPGLPGMGEKKAEALLAEHRGIAAPIGLWHQVASEYKRGPFTFKDGTTTVSPRGHHDAYLEEQGKLLWIQRQPDEQWTDAYFRRTYL